MASASPERSPNLQDIHENFPSSAGEPLNHIADAQGYLNRIDKDAFTLHVAVQGCQNALSLAQKQYSDCNEAYIRERHSVFCHAEANKAFQVQERYMDEERNHLWTLNKSLQEELYQLGETNEGLQSRVQELETLVRKQIAEKRAFDHKATQLEGEKKRMKRKQEDTAVLSVEDVPVTVEAGAPCQGASAEDEKVQVMDLPGDTVQAEELSGPRVRHGYRRKKKLTLRIPNID